MKRIQTNPSGSLVNLLLVLLVLLGIMSGAYFALRYSGWVIEVDSSRMSAISEGIVATGGLRNYRPYRNGFGYGAMLAALNLITGIEIPVIQVGSGITIFMLLLVAFAAYRQILSGALSGLVATFLLLLQPDFLFYVVRASHERVTWMFALLMLFLLLRSQQHAQAVKQLFIYIALFYLSFWTMVMSNVFFASTFLLAISIGLAIGWIFERVAFRKNGNSYLPGVWMKRLLLISLSGFILIFLFIFYAYLPAKSYFYVFTSLADQMSLLFFGAEEVGSVASYQYVGTAWRHQSTYLLLTGMQWIIAVSGLSVWVWSTLHLFRLNHKQRFLWQMYTSFGVLLAFGVIADFAGYLSSNLQLRLFTPFAMFSSAMVVMGMQVVWPKLTPPIKQWLVPAAGMLAIFAFVAAQAKITNDPLFSNQWLFFTPAETRSHEWIDRHMENRIIWVDTWDHLQQVFYFQEGYKVPVKNGYIHGARFFERQNVLLSDRVVLESNRKGLILPSVVNDLKIYDNGSVRIFHPRPMTPYQR